MSHEAIACFIFAALLGSAGWRVGKNRKKMLAGVLLFFALLFVAIGTTGPNSFKFFELIEERSVPEAENRSEERRSPEDFLALATEKWRARDYDEAFADVNAGLKLNPKDKRVTAALMYRKASIYHSVGLIEKGMKNFKAAMEIDPEFSWPHIGMGTVYYNQGKLKEAEREFNKTVRLDPKFARGYVGVGNIYFIKGKLEEAEKEYKVAIRLNPEYSKTHNNLGFLYEKQGNLEKALEKYEEALRLKPDYTLAKENLENLKRKMKGEDKVRPESPDEGRNS